jgi:hypothetical protein
MEAVMPAHPIKPQQMIAQQRQFFVLAQRPDGVLANAAAIAVRYMV